jgi:hypothetical protein
MRALADAAPHLACAQRAVTAEVKLCFAPMSTYDRKWRKKSGDAKVSQRRAHALQPARLHACSGAPAASLHLACVRCAYTRRPADRHPRTRASQLNKQCLTKIAEFAPPMAVTGLAVSDVAYPPNLVNGVPAISPIKFCRPLADPTFANGVNPLGNVTALPLDCVKSGQSWKMTKPSNYDLTDPDWYNVTFTFGDNTAKGVYFVRVFAKDANGSYIGFGSSAGSANLTNNNAQNYFKADPFDAVHSYGKNGEHSFDIQAGAIGCSVMTISMGTAYFVYEFLKEKRAAKRDTEVVAEEKPAAVEAPAAEVAEAPTAALASQ